MLKHHFKNKQWVGKSRRLLFINSPHIFFYFFIFFSSFLLFPEIKILQLHDRTLWHGWWVSKNVDLFLSLTSSHKYYKLDRINRSLVNLQGYPSFRDSVVPWLTPFPISQVLDSRAFFPDGTQPLHEKYSNFFDGFLISLPKKGCCWYKSTYIISYGLAVLCSHNSKNNTFYGHMQCCTISVGNVIPELHAFLKIFVIGTMDPYNFQSWWRAN